MKALLVFLLLSSAAFAADSPKILMLVTSASEMTSGKPTGLWLEEFAVPYEVFTKAGYAIEVVTPKGGAAPVDPRSQPTPEQAVAWKAAAERLKQTKALKGISAPDYAAIFIPGGHGVMFDLATDAAAAQLIGDFAKQGKIIAAVCHGPAALVNVKGADGQSLVAGRKLATFTDSEERAVKLDQEMPFRLESKLRELGAQVETAPNFTPKVVRDGNLITGQNPPSSQATADRVIEVLKAN